MKSTVIFADKDKPEEKKVILSRDEYKEVIKEAYKEGLQDSVNEQPNPQSSNAQLQQKTPEAHPQSQIAGEKDAARIESTKEEQTKRKLEIISNRHEIELMRVHGVFPFVLFPDTLIIDTTKVTIIKKQMFATENITTIPLKDLADAHVQTAVFLGSLTVEYMPHANSPSMMRPVEIQITCLKRADALRAKNIIKGALVAQSEEIDLAKLSPEEIVTVVEKLGESAGIT